MSLLYGFDMILSVTKFPVGLCLLSVCSDAAASDHQRNADRLECSERVLEPGAECSDVPGQSPGD